MTQIELIARESFPSAGRRIAAGERFRVPVVQAAELILRRQASLANDGDAARLAAAVRAADAAVRSEAEQRRRASVRWGYL